jgi:hypothetical protein
MAYGIKQSAAMNAQSKSCAYFTTKVELIPFCDGIIAEQPSFAENQSRKPKGERRRAPP